MKISDRNMYVLASLPRVSRDDSGAIAKMALVDDIATDGGQTRVEVDRAIHALQQSAFAVWTRTRDGVRYAAIASVGWTVARDAGQRWWSEYHQDTHERNDQCQTRRQ